MKHLTFSEAMALMDSDWAMVVEVYKADEKGNVYENDLPRYVFSAWKEAFIGDWHVEDIKDKKLDHSDKSSIKDFQKEYDKYFGNLHVLGFRTPRDWELQEDYKLAICVKY